MASDPFDVFCLYYLGLTPDGEVRFQNANQVARRFNWTPDALLEFLATHRIHPDLVLHTDFPLSRYQVDLQIAAEEEDTKTLHARALQIYEDFGQTAGKKRRDWAKEMEAEREADREAALERRREDKSLR